MRFVVRSEAGSPWFELAAEPVEADGFPPVPSLRLQWPLGDLQADRLAIGAVLTFSPWLAGHIDLPAQISALTAQRITEWAQTQGLWHSVSSIRAGGLPIPRGHRRITLCGDGDEPDADPSGTALVFVPSREGTSESTDSLRIASNVAVLMAGVPQGPARGLIRLGAAVLLAEQLGAASLKDATLWETDRDEFRAAARLLESVALGLTP